MNVEEAILTRRSVRRFLPKPISESIVRELIEVSARAPSGHNIQPWKVYAIAGEVKERLCADILKAAEDWKAGGGGEQNSAYGPLRRHFANVEC